METNYPWKRQYINFEFLTYEQKRIEEVSKWYKKFSKCNVNEPLDEVSLYTVPVELSTSWKASITELGYDDYIGLSALYNSPQILILALLPRIVELPREYRLIRIIKSKRVNIVNKRLNKVQPAIIIEDWEDLPSDSIYVDISFERRVIEKIISENLVNDKQISLSFQAPITSAPPVHGSFGGVSLSSIAGKSPFAQELIKTIYLMVPPEYRGVVPSGQLYAGNKFKYEKGIKFHLAERPNIDNHILRGVYSNNYSPVLREVYKRYKFSGEYSIFSTLSPRYGSTSQIWKELLKNFTVTEITLPEDLDELPEMDVDLTRLRNAIDEDLWIQVVHARQINPSIESDDDLAKITNLIMEDLDIILSDVHRRKEDREILVRSMLCQTQYNLKRIAQSLARSLEKEIVTFNELKSARNLIVDNFRGFIYHPEFKRMRWRMERNKESARFSVVQTIIINNPRSSARKIYELAKSAKLFKDIYDLQGLLDWMHKGGYIIESRDKRYTWLGGYRSNF